MILLQIFSTHTNHKSKIDTMKRKTLKRKISIVGILVFVSMIVYSCWQDEWSSNVTDEVIFDSNKELTIAKAEQWYQSLSYYS